MLVTQDSVLVAPIASQDGKTDKKDFPFPYEPVAILPAPQMPLLVFAARVADVAASLGVTEPFLVSCAGVFFVYLPDGNGGIITEQVSDNTEADRRFAAWKEACTNG